MITLAIYKALTTQGQRALLELDAQECLRLAGERLREGRFSLARLYTECGWNLAHAGLYAGRGYAVGRDAGMARAALLWCEIEAYEAGNRVERVEARTASAPDESGVRTLPVERAEEREADTLQWRMRLLAG
jgi:hypothetical protein